MTAYTLNRRLATLLGWTNIIELGGALLGTPPAGEPQCRGQALVPDWEGDWRACGPLWARYRMNVGNTELESIAICGGANLRAVRFEPFADHPDDDAAVRRTMVAAVIAKLEAGQ